MFQTLDAPVTPEETFRCGEPAEIFWGISERIHRPHPHIVQLLLLQTVRGLEASFYILYLSLCANGAVVLLQLISHHLCSSVTKQTDNNDTRRLTAGRG